MLKRQKNQLSNASYKYHTISDHPTHEEHRKVRNLYANEIHSAKKAHWADFLEGMAGGDIWIANRYISGKAKDGGKTRIPTLKLSPPAGSDAPTVEVASNEDKSTMLARLVFPACPSTCSVPTDFDYLPQLPASDSITSEQVQYHIRSLSPYKAPGLDGIPNIVLKSCIGSIVLYLVPMYRTILKLQAYPPYWRDSTTCVLRKPGKPDMMSLRPIS